MSRTHKLTLRMPDATPPGGVNVTVNEEAGAALPGTENSESEQPLETALLVTDRQNAVATVEMTLPPLKAAMLHVTLCPDCTLVGPATVEELSGAATNKTETEVSTKPVYGLLTVAVKLSDTAPVLTNTTKDDDNV